jgi:RNA polymerase sigma factor (sigma-70 family)
MTVTVLASDAVVDSGQARDDTGQARDDTASVHAAFDRCSRSIYRYIAVRVSDTHLADDLMQQLWLQARTSEATIPSDELEFWLRGIARNLVRTQWRRRSRRPANLPLADPGLASELAGRLGTEELPPESLERKEVRDQLLLAITELDSADQELIVEHYFHSRSQVELASERGLSPRGIEGRLYRARQALREKLRNLA